METENYVQMMTDSLIMKKDILEKDTPLLFKVSNHVFGIAFIIMDIFIFYVNRRSLVAYVKGT